MEPLQILKLFTAISSGLTCCFERNFMKSTEAETLNEHQSLLMEQQMNDTRRIKKTSGLILRI